MYSELQLKEFLFVSNYFSNAQSLQEKNTSPEGLNELNIKYSVTTLMQEFEYSCNFHQKCIIFAFRLSPLCKSRSCLIEIYSFICISWLSDLWTFWTTKIKRINAVSSKWYFLMELKRDLKINGITTILIFTNRLPNAMCNYSKTIWLHAGRTT